MSALSTLLQSASARTNMKTHYCQIISDHLAQGSMPPFRFLGLSRWLPRCRALRGLPRAPPPACTRRAKSGSEKLWLIVAPQRFFTGAVTCEVGIHFAICKVADKSVKEWFLPVLSGHGRSRLRSRSPRSRTPSTAGSSPPCCSW